MMNRFVYSKLLKIASLLAITLFTFLNQNLFAQLPADLPWDGVECDGNTIILQGGIAAVTCGVTTEVPAGEQYTFGLINIDGAIPDSGRDETTSTQDVYHHPSWTVDQIGNVFGIAINNTNGCIFLTASSNYGAGVLNTPTVIQYGSIGGGANDLGAAGTVYKIDGITGQASVFSQLPQQAASFTHQDCEGATTITRNTGVGLGNIAYDPIHDQYFVSNVEDGRIYRLDNAGLILDSYDPLAYDDGVAGISSQEEVAYGLAVENDGSRVFFGTIVTPNGGNTPGTGVVPIYSIDLDANGAFVGTVDNTILPAGVPNNYVGTETFHTDIPIGSSTGCTYTNNTTYQISDLTFDPSGNLLVGVREGCESNFQTSYTHWGETNIVTPTGTLYNNVTELDISATGQCGNDDGYGGVAYWDLQDGSGDLQYVVSSSDILFEQGPHGIAVFDAANATSGQISPLGAISYGVVDNGDPKGVGGEVEVFSAPNCCLVTCEITGTTNASCGSGTDATLTVMGLNSLSGTYEYSIDNGQTWLSNSGASTYTFTGLTNTSYTVVVRDLADGAAGCISECNTTIGCDGMLVLESEIVSGFANINSTGGTDPAGLPGPIEPVGSTVTTTNSSAIGNLNRTIVLEFDEVLPAGTVVTISIAVDNNIPFFPASATITDFTNSFVFSGGAVDQLQYIPFTLGQATDKITIDSDNSSLNVFGAVRVDGASFTDVEIITETFVCNECPLCTCTISSFQNITCTGGADGSLTAVGDGSPSGSYLFSLDAFATPGQSTGTFTDLTAGTYTVSVQDAADPICESTCSITLTEPVNSLPKCINEFGEFTIIKYRP